MKRHLFRWTKAITAAVLAATMLTVPALAANTGGATVSASLLNLRAGADTGSAIMTTAPRGAVIVVEAAAGHNWYKVWYKGYEGYMLGDYLKRGAGLDADIGSGTVKGSTVRMRAAPSYSGAILGYCDSGAVMDVTGVYGAWYKVSCDGTTGYIHSDYMTLSVPAVPVSDPAPAADPAPSTAPEEPQPSEAPADPQPAETPAAPSTEGQRIVETAEKYLGTPYVWAGASPSGFDCSGFVYYVFKECGYSLNRTAAGIYSNGVGVSKAELQPGDTVHFTTTGSSGIGHVGIYIGDGQFIHSSSGSGKVIISSLSESYYTQHYVGARRIVTD